MFEYGQEVEVNGVVGNVFITAWNGRMIEGEKAIWVKFAGRQQLVRLSQIVSK